MKEEKINKLEQLNKRRKRSTLFVVLGIASGIIAFILFASGSNIGVVPFIVGIVLVIIGFGTFSAVSHDFKNKFLKEMVDDIFEDANYYPKKGVDKNTVYRCNFLKKADRFHSEDLINGKIDGVNFQSSDLRLQERHVRHTKNGTQTYYVTYFLGRFFEFDFPKDFIGHLLVTEGRLMTSRRGLENIEMESIDFNKKFNTYSNNHHHAFYILTPHLMEAIMELERRHPGSILLCFLDNKFSLAINNHQDTFEIKMFRKIDQRLFIEMERDLLVVKEIVHELKLNRNIFK